MNIDKTVIYNKRLGESSLDAVKRFKAENSLDDTKVAYAGRLDPMAEGQLLLMIGDECKKRDFYQNHDKTYEFEFILGFSSDSYDLLGMSDFHTVEGLNEQKVARKVAAFKGRLEQFYPPYSSFHIGGKPLFAWAKEGKLDSIQIPSKEVEIYSSELLGHTKIDGFELLNQIKERISKVRGDFRQEQILRQWEENFSKHSLTDKRFYIYKAKANVSSGTYIRALVSQLGKELGTNAITFSINRTSLSEHKISSK